eukprot:831830_1
MPLSSVDSRRIGALLEHSVNCLGLVGILASQNKQDRRTDTTSASDEAIESLIDSQRTLQNRYQELVSDRNGLTRSAAHMLKLAESREELAKVSKALRSNAKQLDFALQRDEARVARDLGKILSDKNELEELFMKTVEELDSGSYETFRNKVETDRLEHLDLVESEARANEATTKRKEIEQKIATEIKEHSESTDRPLSFGVSGKIRKRDKKIADLVEELKLVRFDADHNTGYDLKTMEAERAMTSRIRKQRLLSLEEDHERAYKLLDIEDKAHMATDRFMQVRVKQLIEGVDQWTERMSKETTQMEGNLRELKEERESDYEKLCQLEERMKQEDAAKAARAVADLERARQERESEDEAKRAQGRAVLEMLFRRFMAESAPPKRKKGGKKGKKKTKKK